jgi:hypothetical protein
LSRLGLLAVAGLGLLGGLLGACRSTVSAGDPLGGPAGAAAGEAASAPWFLADDAYPTQRLFRLQAESTKEGGSLRLVLRLESPDRYRLTISDRLGRSLYTVDATPEGGWLLDHRERRACRLGPALALGGVPLEAFAPAMLPRVLLGRVPAEPASRVSGAGAGRLEFRDRQGRRWTVERRGGAILGWVAWEGGEPVVWWRRLDGEALLSDRIRGVQMRWHQVARERLEQPLPPAAVPAGYTSGPCDEGAEAVGPSGS